MTSARVAEIDGHRILLANPEALVWADEGITRGDLMAYYLDVAPHQTPFLTNRPVSLLRVDGTGGECMYQKTAPPGLPPWIPTRRLRSDQTALGYAEHVVNIDRAAMTYFVNLGYVSFHPWGAAADAVDRPDQQAQSDPFRDFFAHRQSLRPLLESSRVRRARPIA
jgi:bifunctional non-homologous end joining protein LigD